MICENTDILAHDDTHIVVLAHFKKEVEFKGKRGVWVPLF